MSASRILQKKQNGNQFLSWIASTLGGPIETRGVRLTWDVAENKLKTQIRITSGSSTKSKLTFPGLVSAEKKNVFQKIHAEKDESKWMLNDLLKICWNVCDKNSSSLNKSGFIRSLPDLAEDKAIVEFASPNIAKPLHMGHLRSLVTGHFCARICKSAGHDVKNICFLGDWGTQFGILQAGLAKWLPEDQNVASTVEKLSLDELLRYYVKAVNEKENNPEFFSQALKLSVALEQKDADCLKVWNSIREKTISHLKPFWSLFDVTFDHIQGESEFTVQSTFTDKALKDLKELGVIEVAEDNCVSVVLNADEKFSKTLKIPLVKKDGASLYLLRDIACAISRKEKFGFNRMIYVVDKAQAHHFIALFRILELLKIQKNKYHEDGWEKKLWHVTFGKVEGMSTRSGNFVLLSDVINTGSVMMQENRVKSPNARNIDDLSISTQLAISALIVNSLKVRRNRDVVFDWNDALKPTGDTGVNLQYTHARLLSLEKNVAQQKEALFLKSEEFSLDIDYLMNDPVALNLAVHLINFEDAFWSSYSELEPCILLTYLFKLSDKVSKSLKTLQVMNETNEKTAATRLSLFMLSRKILGVGLNTLGIRPLNEI